MTIIISISKIIIACQKSSLPTNSHRALCLPISCFTSTRNDDFRLLSTVITAHQYHTLVLLLIYKPIPNHHGTSGRQHWGKIISTFRGHLSPSLQWLLSFDPRSHKQFVLSLHCKPIFLCYFQSFLKKNFTACVYCQYFCFAQLNHGMDKHIIDDKNLLEFED